MKKTYKILCVMALVVAVLIVLLFVWSGYFKDVKYIDAEYYGDNVKNLSDESRVSEVKFLVELVNVKDISEEDRGMIFIPYDEDWDNSKGYIFTLKEKINGQWNVYSFSSFRHASARSGAYSFFERNTSIYCEKYDGVEVVIYAERNSSLFGNDLSSINIKVSRDSQMMYKTKLKIVKE